MNTILATLWPYYNAAVGKIAVKEAAKPLADVCAKVPAGILQAIDIEALDLGTKALAIGGIKAYSTKDDSCVFEAPIQWGSDLRVRIGVRLKFGPFVVHLPLEVAGVQVRAVARIALTPLVEELPCLGGAEVSLLEQPYYDLTLRLGTSADLMRLPFVKPAVDAVVRKVVADMLLYPNKFSLELMPGGGLPPPPLGMVEVTIHSVTDINGGGSLLTTVDPYVEVQCRKGRVTRTRTVWNCTSPEYEETIAAIVDDPDNQALNVRLVDDKGGYNDKVVGTLSLPLLGSAFFAAPREPVRLVLPFEKPADEEEEEEGGGGGGGGADGAGPSSATAKKESLRERVRRQRRAKKNRPEVGLLTCTARYLPFKVDPAQLERMVRAKDARAAAAKAAAEAAVKEATKELAEAQAAVDSAAAGSKKELEQLGVAKRRLDRAVSRAATGAGVDKEGVATAAAAEVGTAAATSSTGAAPATTVADARQEVAEAEEATEDAVAAAQAAKAAAAGRDKAAAASTAGKAAAAAAGAAATPRPPATFIEGPLTDATKGILTLTLVKARNLAATGQVDPFVELSLLDPAIGVPQKQWSATWNNEPNPRWGEKFDFVNVSATSILTINVWDKKGLMEAAFAALKGLTLKRVMTEKIGSLRLRVEEVARNRRIKDEWALQETQKGDITLAMEWFPVEVDGPGGGEGMEAVKPAAAAAGLAGL